MKFVFSHRFVVVLCFRCSFLHRSKKRNGTLFSVFHRRSTKQIKIQSREEIWYWLKFYFSIFVLRWNFRYALSIYFGAKWRNRKFPWMELRKHLSQLSTRFFNNFIIYREAFPSLRMRTQPESSFCEKIVHRTMNIWCRLLCIFNNIVGDKKYCMNRWRLDFWMHEKLAWRRHPDSDHNLIGEICETSPLLFMSLACKMNDKRFFFSKMLKTFSSLTKAGNPPGFPCST